MSSSVNPFSPAFLEDPYPHYRRLRETDPVCRREGFRGTDWLLTRYRDIRHVLCSAEFGVDGLPAAVMQQGDAASEAVRGRLSQNIRHWLFFVDPPVHGQMRSAFTKDFQRRNLHYLIPEAERIVAGLLADLPDPLQFDLIRDIAAPLPVRLMCRVLGLEDPDYDRIMRLSERIFEVFEQPMATSRRIELGRAVISLEALLEDYLTMPQRLRRDGVFGRLVRTGALRRGELLALGTMLLSVGQDTTKHLIGNSMFVLARDPAACERLTREPQMLDRAVDELARFDTPVQLVVRVARQDTQIGGHRVARGARVHLFLGAGLRDPGQFRHPDRIEFDRGESSNLPFGAGPHFCLGAAIARAASRAVLKTLIRPGRRPTIGAAAPQRLHCVHLRGLSTLPMSVSAQ